MASTTPHRWRLLTLAALAASGVSLVVALLSVEQPKLHIRKVPLPPAILQCTSDADCVMVNRIGCCSCKAGGARGAIRAAARDEFRLFLKRTCRHRGVCVRVRTCWYDLAPACVAGRCLARAGHG